MTVKRRITLFIVGAGFIAGLLFSIVVFFELLEQPFDILDNVLKEEAYKTTRMAVSGEKQSDAALLDAIAHETDSYWVTIIAQDNNRMLYQSRMARVIPLPLSKAGADAVVKALVPPAQFNLGQDSGRRVAFRLRTFVIELDGKAYKVQIARPIVKLEEELSELKYSLGAGFIFSILALVAISHFVAGKILRPIGAMKDLAQEISEKNLSRRIPIGPGHDEFNDLAGTINRMLDRLQYSFVKQKDFLFDTSHELKTPLTTMRLALDEVCASNGEKLSPPAKESLSRVSQQVLRMERLVKDLLNLSALEMMDSIEAQPVQITELLSALAADYQIVAEARGIRMQLRLAEHLVVNGDAEKLRRAFSNVLDNALKYNVDGGRVEIAGESAAGEVQITISNSGAGLAAADTEKVFEQFYRTEKSRSAEHGGSGLGLTIAKRIVELHHGKIALESGSGTWTRASIRLPQDLTV